MLEARTRSHCFGIFPYAADIAIDAEDSLALQTEARRLAPAGARIAIVRLPCLSNATDFRLLTWADWITGAAGRRLRLRRAARHEEHHWRPQVAAFVRPVGVDSRAASPRRHRARHLRRVPDDGAPHRRSARRRRRRLGARARVAAGRHRDEAGQADGGEVGNHARRHEVHRL